MVKRDGTQTLAVDVYRRLRTALVNGQHRTGERLLPSALAAEYGVSPTVIREALMRLAEQQLAQLEPNRGFRVLDLTLDDMHELVEVRLINESAALRASIERGDLRWEGSILAAHHQMQALSPDRDEDEDAWYEAHRAFHLALLNGCGNTRLLNTCSNLIEVGDLYLRWTRTKAIAGTAGSSAWHRRDQKAEHQAIMDAALTRDPDLALAHYQSHLRRSERLAAEVLSELSSSK